jgi:hypothetical protein
MAHGTDDTAMGATAAGHDGDSRRGQGAGLQAAGVLLFLFIPLVLFLFVRHPAPIGASLAAGVVLMLGHRLVARPYMARAAARKCLWCNRLVAVRGDGQDPAGTTLDLRAGDGGAAVAARCCPGHGRFAARFLRLLGRARWPLRVGIFLPLLLLLGALAAAAVGAGPPGLLAVATAVFQLVVGVTVSAAAWGTVLIPDDRAPDAAIVVPFPLHNFFLLGVQPLLWIFRIVGAWWIWRGASALLW